MEMNLLSHFSVSDLVQFQHSPLLTGCLEDGIINKGQMVEALKATLIVDNVCAGLVLQLILTSLAMGRKLGVTLCCLHSQLLCFGGL